MQFVDVKTDIAFKKIFGSEQHKEILIAFLNALLELEGDKRIKDVTLKNPWQPPDIPLLKETILDIKAVDNRGISFLVEMQIRDTNFFDKRALYYTDPESVTDRLMQAENTSLTQRRRDAETQRNSKSKAEAKPEAVIFINQAVAVTKGFPSASLRSKCFCWFSSQVFIPFIPCIPVKYGF